MPVVVFPVITSTSSPPGPPELQGPPTLPVIASPYIVEIIQMKVDIRGVAAT